MRKMAGQPYVILSPEPRTLREVFDPADLDRLRSFTDVAWARDEPIPSDELTRLLPNAWAYVGGRTPFDATRIASGSQLRAIVEVAGAFSSTIDYRACFDRGIRVLSCAPAFGPQVAEMALTLVLAAGRGVVAAHEDFRKGCEEWQGERTGWDFTLFNQQVGFIGCGSLARNLLPLLAPFRCTIRVYDPWLPDSLIRQLGCIPASLDEVLRESRVTLVLATPTPANRRLLGNEQFRSMPRHSLLVLISRAHLVDFDALCDAIERGHLQAAIDVFPDEPLAHDHRVRRLPNVALSAHRAAALREGRQLIGQMVVDDLELMSKGLPPTQLQVAQPEHIRMRLGEPQD